MAIDSRILARWRKSTQWHKDHRTSFATVREPASDGLTPFQIGLLAKLAHLVPATSFQRAVHDDGTMYLVAPLVGSASVYIYDTEAGVFGPSHEWPFDEGAFRTPEELYEAVVTAVESLLAT